MQVEEEVAEERVEDVAGALAVVVEVPPWSRAIAQQLEKVAAHGVEGKVEAVEAEAAGTETEHSRKGKALSQDKAKIRLLHNK